MRFLCLHGYSTKKLKKITKDNITCGEATRESSPQKLDLNYPSMTLLTNSSIVSGLFWRIVTNVGPANSVYNVEARAPPSLRIGVDPGVLSFTRVGEKKSFLVRAEGSLENRTNNVPLLSGSITWADDIHNVKLPWLFMGHGCLCCSQG